MDDDRCGADQAIELNRPKSSRLPRVLPLSMMDANGKMNH